MPAPRLSVWFVFSAAPLEFSGLIVPRPSTLALGVTPDDKSVLNCNKGYAHPGPTITRANIILCESSTLRNPSSTSVSFVHENVGAEADVPCDGLGLPWSTMVVRAPSPFRQ